MTRCTRAFRVPTGVSVAFVLAMIVLLSATGCTRAKAKTSPDIPALDMPAAPPRDVELTESEPPQPATLPTEPARNATPRPRPVTPAQPQRATEPRQEAPRTEAAPPIIEAPKPAEESKPPTTLQTTPTQAEGEVERTIRTTLTRASTDLNRIDYRVLNADARVQYDTAKSFVRQADAAIRAKNLVFAKTMADKAATLAAQLSGK
jgi:hypothetical protein